MVTEALKQMKARKKTKAPRDAAYREAWRACRQPWVSDWPRGSPRLEIDLRAALRGLLRSGWNIRALKAYAFSVKAFARSRKDHVTAGVWRWAVYFASLGLQDGPLGARTFLAEFKADPERYAWMK